MNANDPIVLGKVLHEDGDVHNESDEEILDDNVDAFFSQGTGQLASKVDAFRGVATVKTKKRRC